MVDDLVDREASVVDSIRLELQALLHTASRPSAAAVPAPAVAPPASPSQAQAQAAATSAAVVAPLPPATATATAESASRQVAGEGIHAFYPPHPY